MPTVFQRALGLLTGSDDNNFDWLKPPTNRQARPVTKRDLLRRESRIGAQLFGPVPEGHTREFFCLDERTWIWYEEWTNPDRSTQSSTTRYEVQKNGILKVQDGARYSYIEGQEFDNLVRAIQMYYERVAHEIYRVDPYSGQPLNYSYA